MNCIKKYLKQHAILCCGLLAFANTSYAQGNYIRTYDATAPQQNATALMGKWVSDVKIATQYFDGLGRPIQTVVRQGSLETATGAIADVVSTNVYDALGREQFKYSPFVANNIGGGTASITDGNFKTNALAQQQAFMTAQYGSQGETYFYAKTDFEPSPLNRPIKAMPIGNSWVGSNRGVEIKYWINTLTDDVKNWVVTDVAGGFGTYALSTTSPIYNAGELTKNVSIDEHGKQVINFTDKEGKVILKKVQISNVAGTADDGTGRNHTGWLCTYYLYDDFNRLRCVIQPRGVELLSASSWQLTNTTLLAEQCFRYEYDGRGRMIMKKVPGAGEVYMVYDSKDRLVMMQDANMRIPPSGGQGGWLVTKYDFINRPIETGMWTSTITFATHQINAAAATTDYPATTTNYEVLSVMHYDDYASLPAGLTASFNTAYSNNFSATDNATWPYPQMPVQSNTTRGMVTWSKTKVLGTASQFISSVIFYDDKGRAIQSQSTNITGGIDISTTQYTWAGQPLVMVSKQQNAAGSGQTTITVSQMTYDDLGRVVKTEKKLSNTLVNGGTMAAYKTIAENKYDKLGQLINKNLGTKPTAAAPLAKLAYEYNIRGWLTSVNKNFVAAGNTGANNDEYFGMQLGYDKDAFGAFTKKQYNGNISGSIWRSAGDGIDRKYDYDYDAANRLLKADFTQHDGTAFTINPLINFNVKMGDGIDPNSAYDYNGNILKMQQWGLKINASPQIDNLTYTYIPNTNKLKGVTDAANDNTSKLGDFKYDPATKTATDYGYDENGNMVSDENKKIQSITYNHLNLPLVITIASKGNITYTYDAGGSKIRKVTFESPTAANNNKTITTTTNYINGLVYESKTTTPQDATTPPDYADVLQYIPHEEGRIRFKPAVGNIPACFAYDYVLKDHLNNTRVVITEEQKIDAYPAATLETATLATEKKYYSIPDDAATRVNKNSIPAYPTDNTTSPNDFIHKLSGNGTKVGSSITLKVMAGDKFNVKVSSWYKTNGATINPPDPANQILPNIISSLLSGVTGAITQAHGTTTASQIQSSGVLTPNINNFLGTQTYNTQAPKAYLNWILFDEQFNFVSSSSGAEQVPAESFYGIAPNNQVKQHVQTDLPINKSGYLYVYVSNETPNIDVFFDNLQVTHTRGALLETDQYYSFGLKIDALSYRAGGGMESRRMFNGGNELQSAEFSDGGGLELYDANNRMYDPQLGRFWQVDELAEGNWEWSPYNFALNNPIRLNDPLGLEAEEAIKKRKFNEEQTLATVVVTSKPRKLSHEKMEAKYWDLRLSGKGFDGVSDKLKARLEKWDGVQRHMERVHAMTREQDMIALEVGSFFIPTGWITKLKYVKYAANLFSLKRGVTAFAKLKPLITVIGKCGRGGVQGFEKVAAEMGYNSFQISDDVWKAMSEAERWAANSKFLADVVARGDEIIFSHKVKAISGEVGVFRKELEYLSEQGYKLASDGLGMVK
jgi:RHS repeat-associated protein